MANARELLSRRNSVTNTRKITRTMELVASSKARKAQMAAEASKPYALELGALVSRLAEVSAGVSHPLMTAGTSDAPVAVLVATADRGLCGAFNANVLRLAVKHIEALKAEGVAREISTLGKKGFSTLKFFGYEPNQGYQGVMDAPKYAKALDIIQPLIRRFLAGEISRIDLIYPVFQNVAKQVPTVMTVVPVGLDHLADPDNDGEANAASGGNTDYIYHPDAAGILEGLVPQSVRTRFYSALLETSAGEHNARRMAMKNATDAANDLIKILNSSYNRARQTKITQEIAEIVGAVEAMS